MHAIEPNVFGLATFAALWTTTCLGFLVLSGMYPAEIRPQGARGAAGTLLVATNSVLWIALAAGTLLFGYESLRPTSLIVVSGLVFLFSPVPFEFLPEGWRDGWRGLAVLVALQVAALAAWMAVSGHSARILGAFT